MAFQWEDQCGKGTEYQVTVMNLLQLHSGSKQYGAKILFKDARFSINEGDHVGVIGPNGAGKTTLFRILAGLDSLDSGELIKAQKLSIGYLEQEAKEPGDISAEEYLEQSCITPIWELKKLGLDLGLSDFHFQRSFQELSGGYRMRMKLLQLIGREPNLMLLDEPTNFLDLESILTLEKFLQGYRRAFLLISHDREFLKRTTEHTLEVESPDITKFPGHIDDYFEQKAQLRTILEAQAANQENKRKSVQDFVDRFGAKATKARQAQSRLKMLDKMEKIEIKDLPVKAKIKIPEPVHTGKETLNLLDADLGYTDKKIIGSCQLRLERGDHLGVVGFNGVGKSTLLKSLAGRLPLLRGEVKLGYQVSLSYYAQHVSEDLDPNDTVLSSLQKTSHPDVKAQEILNLAGSLLFSGESVYKKIKVLSGGEKSRVAIGQILLKRSPLLLLDEPTNHLDFDTVEALTESLREYAGSLIVVSHDRSFIGRIATKILEIRDGRAEIYPGTYDDYLWSLEKGALKERYKASVLASTGADSKLTSNQKVTAPAEKSLVKKGTKQLQAELRELQKKLSKAEETLQIKNQQMQNLNTELLSAKGTRVAEISNELKLCGDEIQKIEDSILSFMENIEGITSQDSGGK